MRKLILCMDGTNNEIGDGQTNIVKLYATLAETDAQRLHYIMGVGTDDDTSVIRRPFQRLKGAAGLAFGWGLEDDVLDGYRWLCRSYKSSREHEDDWRDDNKTATATPDLRGDQIYLMGFSRGAYAARVLAGFIHNFGLVAPDKLHLIAPVFRAYRSLNARDHANQKASMRFKALRHYTQVLDPQPVPIRALLLFDTVASMIRLDWPWYTLPDYWSLLDLGLHTNVKTNESVRIVIQALAIDERRSFFRPLAWTQTEFFGNRFRRAAQKRRQYVRQRWFAGFHSDIGGSTREDEAGISKISALWMLNALSAAEAEANAEDKEAYTARRAAKGLPKVEEIAVLEPGLGFARGAYRKKIVFLGMRPRSRSAQNPSGLPYAQPDPRAKLHQSVFSNGIWPSGKWFWIPFELFPKAAKRRSKDRLSMLRMGWPYYLPFFEPRYIPDDHEVDDSVYIRRDDPAMTYAPRNLRRETPDVVTPWWDAELD